VPIAIVSGIGAESRLTISKNRDKFFAAKIGFADYGGWPIRLALGLGAPSAKGILYVIQIWQ
jgi:hypothetical protein